MNTESERSNPEDTINLLDYCRVLIKYRWLIGWITGSALVISVIVSLLLPSIYAATSSILPPQQEALFSTAALSQIASGLGSEYLTSTIGTPDLWVGILKSHTVRDAIIDTFDLKKVYGVKTIEGARAALHRAVKIKKSRTEGIISITVENRDPESAADIANAFAEELDRINRDAVSTSGRRVRVSVEERLKETKREHASLEENLRAFQEEHQAIQLDAQSTTIIQAIAAVKGQLMAKEVELQTFLSYATRINPRVGFLETQVKELKNQLKELEEGTLSSRDNPAPGGIFIPTASIPGLTMEYARLVRDAKAQETLIELLTLQYEMARIQEAKDSPTVQVLDVAKPAEKKVKPKRAVIVLGSTFFAAAVAILIAFLLVYIERVRMQDTKLGAASKTTGG